jgi:hypothetical protein
MPTGAHIVMSKFIVLRKPSSQDVIDYADMIANITDLHLQLCTPYELSAMLAKIIGSLMASADPDMADEFLMEFILTNVMDAKYGV